MIRFRHFAAGVAMVAAAFVSIAATAQDDADIPILITAETITYDTAARTVTAEGDVELTRENERLLADRITYNQATDRVFAFGNIVLLGSEGDTLFAEELELDGALRDGFVDGVAVLFDDNSRLAGVRALRREGNLTIMQNAVYSPCELCEDQERAPIWQIRARTVIHDEDAKTITYRHAVFEFFGVPIAYSPFFKHPDPTVERKSGFLIPTFGSSSELGLTLETPYFFDLGPSQDFTFSPIFTTGAGTVLGGEFRDLSRIGIDSSGNDRVADTVISGSFTYTDAYTSDPDSNNRGEEFRGNLLAEGDYDLDNGFDTGFKIDLASDNTYLERYSFSNADVLTNVGYVRRFRDREAIDLSSYYFQSLRIDDPQGEIPIVLPEGRYSSISEPWRWGSRWTVDSSALSLYRTDGLDTRRVSFEGGWELPKIGAIGDVFEFRASLRGDFYNTEGDPETFGSEGGDNSDARLLPQLAVDWGWPLVGTTSSWQHVIEPRVTVGWASPNGNSDEIPNEDSQVFEFDETNLFEESRFPGIDRVEEGPHVAYGLAFSSTGPRALRISGVIGQNYSRETSVFPENSGLDTNFSDYVGRLDFQPSTLLNVSYRFRLAKDELNFRRSDLNVAAGPRAIRATVNYTKLSEELPGADLDEREEIVAGLRLQLFDNLAVAAQTRRDLNEDRTVANSFGLIYTDSCVVLVMGLEQSNTTRGEIEEETVFQVRLALRNLGSLETGTGG